MKKLSITQTKWLKALHLLTAGCWVTGAGTLSIMYFMKKGHTNGDVVYGMNESIRFIDNYVVVLFGAIGCLLTGLIYGFFTNWGFFKHKWLIFKWVVTVGCILFGTFFLGEWEKGMTAISAELRGNALTNAAYLYNQKMQFTFGTVQTAILIVTVFVSVFKPWKKKS